MLAKFRARSDPVPAPRFCERSFAREADRLAACAQTQNQITTMPSELPGVTAIDIGNKNVATGKNDIESTSTGLKKKVTLGLLLVLLIAAVGSTAAAFVVILGKDNQVAAPPEEGEPQVLSNEVNVDVNVDVDPVPNVNASVKVNVNASEDMLMKLLSEQGEQGEQIESRTSRGGHVCWGWWCRYETRVQHQVSSGTASECAVTEEQVRKQECWFQCADWSDWIPKTYSHDRCEIQAEEVDLASTQESYQCGFHGNSEACDMTGFIPQQASADGKFPIFIHVVGTDQRVATDITARPYAMEMAQRGFCAFSVDYARHNTLQYAEGNYIEKSGNIYSLDLRHSAINRIMRSDSRCDVTKGVVTSGFSQGGHIALWAKYFLPRYMKGLLQMSSALGVDWAGALAPTPDIYVHVHQNHVHSRWLGSDFKWMRRSIISEWDIMFGRCVADVCFPWNTKGNIPYQQKMLTGHDCGPVDGNADTIPRPGYDCIDGDTGSGYYIMTHGEGLEHEFYMNRAGGFTESWATGDRKGSSMKDNFDWLASCQLEGGCGTGYNPQ